MSEKDIIKFLQALGLHKREIEIYLFLAKSGVQSTGFVAKRLKMERVQAYRTFKKMKEKGFIESTLERPTRFSIVPFEVLFASFINARKSEVAKLNEQKERLLSSWRTISAPKSDYEIAKISVFTGKKKIHSKMLGMIEKSKREVLILTTDRGLIQEDIAGVLDAITHPAQKRGVKFKIITNISQKTLNIVERLNKNFSVENMNVEWRHLSLNFNFFPRFLIKDEEETILYAPSGDEASVISLEDEGLWINDKMFISIMKAFFIQIWQNAVDAKRRIEELKTGIPLEETMIIRNPEEVSVKIAKILDAAKEDVIAITSSQSINIIFENDPFAKHCRKGLRFRIMASIDLDNLEAAKKLSNNYQIKHVSINYLTMMIIDNKHLFMFKSPPLSGWYSEFPFYMVDTLYTNDLRSIERASEMLNDIWKRGTEISAIGSQVGMKLPTEVLSTETVSEVVDTMFQNKVDSILITENHKPIGIITDRDLLKEVVENRKAPRKTLIKELNYTPLIVLDRGESIIDALKTMRKKGIKQIAVIKNGQLIGMLTEDLAFGKTDV
ncbi:MAG: CBS domain-containing protein [Candidatus Bathyarchaeota archaeon]|nr:CBS domain-containing protein [Candidatus Bathyarchaeota archaeon]